MTTLLDKPSIPELPIGIRPATPRVPTLLPTAKCKLNRAFEDEL